MEVKFDAKVSGGRIHIPKPLRTANGITDGKRYRCIIQDIPKEAIA